MRPNHRPPKIHDISYDKSFLLFALNLLIEDEVANSLPKEFKDWLYHQLIKPGLDIHTSNSDSDRKAA